MNFDLSPGDRQNPLWIKLAAHYRDRLALLRAKNDGLQSEAETAALRGRIAEVKALLALDAETPVVTE